MGALGVFAQVIANSLINPSTAGNTVVTVDGLIGFVDAVEVAIGTIGDVFATADDRAAAAVSAAQDAGDQIAAIGEDLRLIVEHTYATVIPESLRWLRGDLILHYIDPLRAAIHHINKVLSELISWQHGIDHWRRSHVDPELRQLEQFRHFFYTWPIIILQIVHQWIDQPQTFANFATPLIARPFVELLGSPLHQPLRDQLTAELVDSTPDVFRHVEAAALSILQSSYP